MIYQGAESMVYRKKDIILKDRIKKMYRLKELDNRIRKQRTKKEVKLLIKLKDIIPVPKVINSSEYKIEMENIDGEKLSISLDDLNDANSVCKKIGENLAKVHDSDIIHGDLTTSNMILKDNKVYFIDFGLGFESSRVEDKASDLRLIKQALEAKHFKKAKDYLKNILEGYKKSKNYQIVLVQLKKVEMRGRYKAQY